MAVPLAAASRWLRCAAGAGVLALLPVAWCSHGNLTTVNVTSCTFKMLTGEDCIFCGLTHAVSCATHAEWGAAFAYNPLWPLAIAAMAILAGALLGDGVLRQRRADALARPFLGHPWLVIATIAGLTGVRIVATHAIAGLRTV